MQVLPSNIVHSLKESGSRHQVTSQNSARPFLLLCLSSDISATEAEACKSCSPRVFCLATPGTDMEESRLKLSSFLLGCNCLSLPMDKDHVWKSYLQTRARSYLK